VQLEGGHTSQVSSHNVSSHQAAASSSSQGKRNVPGIIVCYIINSERDINFVMIIALGSQKSLSEVAWQL
jgi:hypothetical protein